MTATPHSRARDIDRGERGRGETGLTTLEWLLIVAAVAGLAALAVVLVQSVVGSTADQIASHSARQTAAEVAAQEINHAANAETPQNAEQAQQINARWRKRCEQIQILYSDTGLTTTYKTGKLDDDNHGWDDNSNSPDTPSCTLNDN